MINRNSHNDYSLEDIEKYLKGKMSAADMHELEKAALEDPFLSDAIEGYSETSLETASTHLQEIKQELLQDKIKVKVVPLHSSTSIKWWRMVAAVLLIAIISTVTWNITRKNNKQGNIADNKKVVITKKDSTATSYTEKNTNSKNDIASIDKPMRSSQNEKAVAANQHRAPEKSLTAKLNQTTEKSIASRDNPSDKNLKQDYIAAIPSIRQDTIILTQSQEDKEIANNTVAVNRHINQDPFAKNEMALQGRLAGVSLYKSKIKQGTENIMIRGSANVSSKNPLYVIDGIVYDSIPPSIPPSMIKSLDVLKDANANALYGAKAVNGVIVISTNLKNKQLRGRIVNQNGQGIADATITVNHNKQFLTTDAQGYFSANSFDSTAVVSVNSVGYQPSQSILKANRQNNIVLSGNQTTLDEVVVVGYGTQKRVTSTGAVSSIASNNSVSKAEMPMPDGGWDKFKEYLTSKLSDGTSNSLHGEIAFQFTLNKARKAKHIIILQSPDENKNNQIIEAVKKGPKWAVKRKTKKYKVIMILQYN
jgi:TonB-dependent SusC/RagA subfamily outer membrane receptor